MCYIFPYKIFAVYICYKVKSADISSNVIYIYIEFNSYRSLCNIDISAYINYFRLHALLIA